MPRRSMLKTSRSKQPSQKQQKGRKPAPTKRDPQTDRSQQLLTDIWSTPQASASKPNDKPTTAEQPAPTTKARKATRDEDAPT